MNNFNFTQETILHFEECSDYYYSHYSPVAAFSKICDTLRYFYHIEINRETERAWIFEINRLTKKGGNPKSVFNEFIETITKGE